MHDVSNAIKTKRLVYQARGERGTPLKGSIIWTDNVLCIPIPRPPADQTFGGRDAGLSPRNAGPYARATPALRPYHYLYTLALACARIASL